MQTVSSSFIKASTKTKRANLKMPENFKVQITKETTDSDCGVLIDIDGFVLKGGKPFQFSKDSLHVRTTFWNFSST